MAACTKRAIKANGNVTMSDGKSFAYDSENHLTSMNGGAVQIVYDGDGNRVAKSVNGVVTRYLVDELNPTGYAQVIEELNGANAVERQYTYGLQRISENQPINNTWTVSFYGYDGGGSVRNLTDSNGAVTDTYEYDAFGNEFTTSGTTPNNYLYRGEQYDSDLGLYYLRARYYNPITGRFLSMDPQEHKPIDPLPYQPLKSRKPLDPKKWHRYLYAGADPVNMLDPRGREEEAEEAGALEDAEALAEEETYKLKTLMEYRLQLLEQGGYEINTEGTESYADELLDDYIKMWDNR